MKQRWIRQAAALVLDHRDAVTVIGRDGVGRRFTDASADLVRAVLEFWSAPRTEEELALHIRDLAGGEGDPAVIAETTKLLRDAGAIQPYADPSPLAHVGAPTRARILVGISGAIAATDAPLLVRLLLARRFDVSVVMTAAARRFVSAESLEAMTHRPVYRTFWQKHEHGPAPHIHLAGWADLIVLYPATAATIARVAHGTCSDVLSATATAASSSILVVPSMNVAMYRSGAVQRNLELLRQDGHTILHPGTGLEVATAPSERVPMLGPAPPPPHVVTAIEILLKDRVERPVAPPASAEAWDRQYALGRIADLPWFTEELDADLADELRTVEKGRLLDVGTGPGTAAIFAARNGFDVVATDISATALGMARRRANGLPIAWVLDDFVDSRLWGRFDVAVDRGCLHCLPKATWPKYVRSAAQLVTRGGKLLLKMHSSEETGRHGTNPASEEEVGEVFGSHFSVVRFCPSVFDGAGRPAPKALLAVLQRRDVEA